MIWTLDLELVKTLYRQERVAAIRALRDRFQTIGVAPDLRTCRDIVDKVQGKSQETFCQHIVDQSVLIRL